MRSRTFRAAWAAAALLSAVASCVPAAGQARPLRTDLERDDLVGPVKTVAVTVALPSDLARFVPVENSTYSTAGWLAERELFADGRSVARVTYADADADGVRRATSTSPDGFGYGVRPTRFQPRDEAVLAVVPKDGAYHFLVARAFDTAGRLLSETVTAGDDPKATPPPPTLARMVYRYDATGRMSERSRFYGPTGLLVEKESITYDANDHVVSIVRYRQSNTMASKTTYEYEFDDRGNWTKRTATELLAGVPTITVTKRAIAYA